MSEDRTVRLDTVPLAVAWSRDGGRILTACKDGRLRGFDTDAMDVIETLAGIDGVAYCLGVAPDGRVLVGGQSGQVKRIGVKK